MNAQKAQPQGRRNASIRGMEEVITLASQANACFPLANVWQTLEYKHHHADVRPVSWGEIISCSLSFLGS